MTRIVVVGDLMTDTVAHAALPLAKGSDTPATVTMHGGGSGANIAAWLAVDGAEVAFVGRRGADIAAMVHDRQTRRPGAFRLGAGHFRDFRDIIAESHHLRPTALRRRQQPRGSSTVGCGRRPSINRRLCS